MLQLDSHNMKVQLTIKKFMATLLHHLLKNLMILIIITNKYYVSAIVSAL